MAYYRTVYTLEVLSQEPISPDMDLQDVLHECEQGAWSGDLKSMETTEVTPWEMARLLNAQRSDPGIFKVFDDDEFMGCGHCGTEIPFKEVHTNKAGDIRCPECGSTEMEPLGNEGEAAEPYGLGVVTCEYCHQEEVEEVARRHNGKLECGECRDKRLRATEQGEGDG